MRMARLLVAKRDPPALSGRTGHPTATVVISLRVMICMLSWANSAVEQQRFCRAAFDTIDRSRRRRPRRGFCGLNADRTMRAGALISRSAERDDYIFARSRLES